MDDAAASASALGSGSGGPASSGSDSGPSSAVPPGFRFHPTDVELLQYYLKKKVSSEKIDLDVIRDVDLNKLEPWELNERCRIGSAPQNEWYFFSHKDKKYPTGSRTNRATAAGFWKATGRDKAIRDGFQRIGMRKTLVFYEGRAPHGLKSNWIMHEYRLDDTQNAIHHHHDDGWVVCRVFKKKNLFKGGPQDVDYEPVSNVEDNRSPGHAISEPSSDVQQFSQVNHYQTMNLSLKQNHLEPDILQYNGQKSRMNQQQLNTSGSISHQLFQNYGSATAGHAHVNSNANPISCGMKRLFPERSSSLSMTDQAADEGIASSSCNCNNSNKRLHYQVCHGEALSSSSSSAQGIPFQLNMSTDSVAEWSAIASHMNMNMMNQEQMQMRFHHQAPPPAATTAGMVDHQLTLPLRNEIDLWNFTK